MHVNGQVNEGQSLPLLSVGLADTANSISVPSSVPTHCLNIALVASRTCAGNMKKTCLQVNGKRE